MAPHRQSVAGDNLLYVLLQNGTPDETQAMAFILESHRVHKLELPDSKRLLR